MGTTMLAMVMILGAPAPRHDSYVEQKNAAVMRSFLMFKSERTVEEDQNRMQQARERDQLLLGGRAPSMQSGALGSMVMGAAVVLVAHAPKRVRAVVDGAVHVGPALFDGGGMGAGVGGRF
jgi:hypothetical protein